MQIWLKTALVLVFAGASIFFASPAHAQTSTPPLTPSVAVTPTIVPLNSDVLFNLVNQQREKYRLPAFKKNESLCTLAQERAPEIYNEIFVKGPMHKGLYNRQLPYYLTENIIHIRSEQAALQWWLNSYVHRSAIMGNYTYSCTACLGKSCSQLFTNFTPKRIIASSPSETTQ